MEAVILDKISIAKETETIMIIKQRTTKQKVSIVCYKKDLLSRIINARSVFVFNLYSFKTFSSKLRPSLCLT